MAIGKLSTTFIKEEQWAILLSKVYFRLVFCMGDVFSIVRLKVELGVHDGERE